ncbi:MAG: HAD family hydrolase [Anaerolineae bacterium]
MSALEAVFFDLDGTLVDYPSGFAAVLEEVYSLAVAQGAAPSLFPIFRRAFWNATIGLWAAMHSGCVSGDQARLRRLQRALAAIGLSRDGLAEEMLQAWDRLNVETLVLKEGALELLTELSTRTYLGLITDGYRTMQRAKIRRFELERYFQGVFISEEAGICKPFAGIFLKALAAADVAVTDAAMVGDNANADIRGALGVGMRAIHLVSGHTPQATPYGAARADSLGEVRELLFTCL